MTNQEILTRLFAILCKYQDDEQAGNFVEYHSPAELKKTLALESDTGNGDWEKIFAWVEQYLKYGVKTAHPLFLNRMWAGANPPSMLAEMAVAVANTSACTYESAPVSTLMEKYMVEQMLELLGFEHGEGQMTTGSSNANMIAMMCGRNKTISAVKSKGLFQQQELFGFVNKEAHYSMDKAANILGIGTDHLIKIEVDEFGAMVPSQLAAEIDKVVAGGGIPFFVGATAGTTVRGAYDPILPLLELRGKYGFWLHVDGAWGGAVVMSDSLREKFLKGVEEVDSFTCDFHKMLGSSLMCNFLLINNSIHTLGTVLAGGDGSYLFRDTDDNEVCDLGTVSLQCGRRVDSLKWFLDWKYYGKEGFGERIEHYLKLCEYAEQQVRERPELELVAPRTSFNLCFRFKTAAHLANSLNQKLRTRLYQKGISLVGVAYVGERLVLRLLVTNLNTGREELHRFFDELVRVGNELAVEGGRE